MRKCINEFHTLIKAKAPCIWVNTYEEEHFIEDLKECFMNEAYEINSFSIANGLIKYSKDVIIEDEIDRSIRTPEAFMELIANNNTNETNPAIYIIKDAHSIINNPVIKRYIRDIKEKSRQKYNPLIFMSPIKDIPIELEKLITVFNYDLLNYNEIKNIINDYAATLANANVRNGSEIYTVPDENEIDLLTKAMQGLTFNEIRFLLTKSIKKYNKFDLDIISENKIKLVEKSGVIKYVVPKTTFNDLGGNQVFKDWINILKTSMTEEAKAFGCEKPKGYIALGPAGSGKTCTAEALAYAFNRPLLSYDVSLIFDKLVGNSEKNVEQAFRIVKACAPCVLLFDEAEKIFGGFGGGENDGGTSSRVFSSVLKFLAEDNDVFIVMTSNDISKLPPELTRAGRLDTTWYFGIPGEKEREEIFRIHFSKLNHEIETDAIKKIVAETDNYTGAEIKGIVKQSTYNAYNRYLTDHNDKIMYEDMKKALDVIVPVYKSSKEKILYLEDYARTRALFANGTNGLNKKQNNAAFNNYELNLEEILN